jgi:hypothetical protein
MKTRKGRPRPDPGCSAADDDDLPTYNSYIKLFIITDTLIYHILRLYHGSLSALFPKGLATIA